MINPAKKRRRLVAGNWKMQGSRAENKALVEGLLAPATIDDRVECLVCPPYVYLPDVARLLVDSPIMLGAQDVSAEAQGAFTGEVSSAMLLDVGCSHVLVGHSERRALNGENDSLVARKFATAASRGLTPVLCIGEQLEHRDAGRTDAVLGRQLDAIFAVSGVAPFARAIIAYEPVWAIGTGRTATAEQAQEAHAFIRRTLGEMADENTAGRMRIQYGGSVKPDNARTLMSQPDIDGALVGGAALDPRSFAQNVQGAAAASA
ncbi:MAG: triose-phosphate isomerase, partial [Steroidobacteraceae bacterium]